MSKVRLLVFDSCADNIKSKQLAADFYKICFLIKFSCGPIAAFEIHIFLATHQKKAFLVICTLSCTQLLERSFLPYGDVKCLLRSAEICGQMF